MTKTVLITGASSGIGHITAELTARRGRRVARMTRNALTGMLFAVGCCPSAVAQPVDCRTTAQTATISEVGAFSNMRQTDEHAYGYTLLLWRAGDCLFGLFESSEGLAGDTPIGELQGVTYESKTGRLFFSVKLTTGMVSLKNSNGPEPSRDLFAFEGSLKGKTATGVIVHTLQNNPHSAPARIDVALAASKTAAELMHGPTTYGEWVRKWQPVLQRRGPKW